MVCSRALMAAPVGTLAEVSYIPHCWSSIPKTQAHSMRPTMIVIAPACSRAPMEARHGTDQIATAVHFLTRLLRWRSTQSIPPLSTFRRAHSALTPAEFTKALTAAKLGTELERSYRVAVFLRW